MVASAAVKLDHFRGGALPVIGDVEKIAHIVKLKLDSSTSNWLDKLLKSLFLGVENPDLVVPQTQLKTIE